MTNPTPAPTVALPPIPVSPPLVRPPSPALAALSKQRAKPKLPSPPDFSSKRSSRRAFLNSCMLYLRLAPEQLTCNKEKIFWTLAFFKDGCAAKWSKNLFRQEADTGIFPIQSWTDFEQQFQSQFFLVNAEADAINTLEGSLYYQGNQTVNDYLDSFLILASDAGYTDPWTLVVKFCHGLKLNVQSQITTMPFGRPADTDPEAWYTAAQRIDQVWLANEAFQSTLCPCSTNPFLCTPLSSSSSAFHSTKTPSTSTYTIQWNTHGYRHSPENALFTSVRLLLVRRGQPSCEGLPPLFGHLEVNYGAKGGID